MLRLERIPLEEADWQTLDAYPDRTIHQTLPWLRFLQQTQQGEPVVALLREGEEIVGCFTGMVIRKLGLRILGSPFPGWTTSYMGFNLRGGICRREALSALIPFAFEQLRCVHLEVMDRRLTPDEGLLLGLSYSPFRGYEIDLTCSEEALFARMTGACRRCIRKAEREGVRIEEAEDAGFADDYYAQLQDVFAKQGRTPTYPLSRVKALIEHLGTTGRLLLLRARDPEGRCIATGIFPAMNDTMYFWGGASWRAHQILRPNEAIQWHAMRYWKSRGITRYDMGGGGRYKEKYGGEPICVPWFRLSRFRLLAQSRDLARRLIRRWQRSH